jgi:hypothetical protein
VIVDTAVSAFPRLAALRDAINRGKAGPVKAPLAESGDVPH